MNKRHIDQINLPCNCATPLYNGMLKLFCVTMIVNKFVLYDCTGSAETFESMTLKTVQLPYKLHLYVQEQCICEST